MFKILAVTGNPILHSKSPQLFNSHLNQSGEGIYTRLAVDSASEALSLFKTISLSGMNITAPFKSEIGSLLELVDPKAQKVGVVNCIYREDEKKCGFNSDLSGIMNPFLKRKIDLNNCQVLVIGGGGAAAAAICALQNLGALVTVINRTKIKAEQLAHRFNCQSDGMESLPLYLKSVKAVVSTLAAEHNVVSKDWLQPDLIIFDADYKQALLAKMATEAGCTVIRGEEWLLEQAIPAYLKFVGREPDYALMHQALMNSEKLNTERIILTGLMGTGKSTTGAILAKKLGWQFYDTDQIIEKENGLSISEIFQTLGETIFREMENELLYSLSQQTNIVIASGGGIVKESKNRQLLKAKFLPVWLWVQPDTALKRIQNADGEKSRPLLQTGKPEATLSELLQQRKEFYAQSCELIVSTENRTPEQTAEKIFQEFSKIL